MNGARVSFRRQAEIHTHSLIGDKEHGAPDHLAADDGRKALVQRGKALLLGDGHQRAEHALLVLLARAARLVHQARLDHVDGRRYQRRRRGRHQTGADVARHAAVGAELEVVHEPVLGVVIHADLGGIHQKGAANVGPHARPQTDEAVGAVHRLQDARHRRRAAQRRIRLHLGFEHL